MGVGMPLRRLVWKRFGIDQAIPALFFVGSALEERTVFLAMLPNRRFQGRGGERKQGREASVAKRSGSTSGLVVSVAEPGMGWPDGSSQDIVPSPLL